MFRCRFCSVTSLNFKQHLEHRWLHSNLSNRFWCGFQGCSKSFGLEISLQSHLRRIHRYGKLVQRTPIATIAHQRGKFVCSITLCKKEFDNQSELIKHLKNHVRLKQDVKCPFENCDKTYDTLSSFTGHLSKKHKRKLVEDVSVDRNDRNSSGEQYDIESDLAHLDELVEENRHPIRMNIFDSENLYEPDSNSDSFLMNVAHLYLKLECQHLIPTSTIQHMISETFNTHQQGQSILRNNLQRSLLSEGLTLSKTEEILSNAFDDEPLIKCHELLKTNFKRKAFYEKHFSYVTPLEVCLETDGENSKFFHYVPIADTLVRLFTDKSLETELNSDSAIRDPDILTDFMDGSVFKQSTFFKENPDGLKLILYQDSFEVVNPIGSAAQKHKILAVYLSVGNLSEHCRSHINSIKLVALCKEKEFDHDKVYGRITEDLKKIEADGIELPSGEIIKGAVVFITGDNLGSHQLGGFIENFSTSTYFCRYCLITRDKLNTEETALAKYETRTIQNYNEALDKIGNQNQYQGVKFDSVFNSLSSYHVCNPGLPPCLGHDLLEGIVAYDMKLFLDILVKENWFSYSTLNKRIESFSYSTADQRDRPCLVSPQKKRIVGGAWQVAVFLRLLPLLIHDKIKDIHNETWNAILRLTEILEVVCAPAIHKSCLSYLQGIVDEYIALRLRLPPKLRPKHHYLTHYVELILQFGPLMKVWTMRFESKHTYFKRVLRFSRNYKNVTKSMSIKHELFQSFLRAGADIRPVIEMKQNSDFRCEAYNQEIQAAVNSVRLPHAVQQYNEIVVKGTSYKKGAAIFIHQRGYQYKIEVGRICILLGNEEDVYIVFEVLETDFRPHLRTYDIGRCIRYDYLPLEGLPSTEPLHIYKIGNTLCVKPTYGLVRRPL